MAALIPLLGAPFLFEESFNHPQETIASDSFNRDDNAASLGALDGGQLAGTAWVPVGTAVFGINGNAARREAAGGIASIESGVADCEISLTVANIGSGGSAVAGIAFRYSSAGHWRAFSDLPNNQFTLQKFVAVPTSLTTEGTYAAAPQNGDVIKVVLLGSSIKVFINGIQRISVTDASFSQETRHGLYLGNNNTMRLDDFSVKTIVPSPQKWTKVDTESKISVSDGSLAFSGGKASASETDPVVSQVLGTTRRAGVALMVSVTAGAADTQKRFGWNSDGSIPAASDAESQAYVQLTTAGAISVGEGTTARAVGSYTATSYRFLFVAGHWDVANRQISANGFTVYVQGGSYASIGGTAWTLLWRGTTASAASLFAYIANHSGANSYVFIRVLQRGLQLPKVYDSMVRADGAIGSAESGQAYTNVQGTAAISSNEGYFSTDTNRDTVVLDSGVGDGIFEASIKGDIGATDKRVPDLIVRGNGSDQYLLVTISGGSLVELYKRATGGTYTQLASASFSGSDDTYYRVTVLAIGAVIRVFVNGALYITHTLTSGNETTFDNSHPYTGLSLVKSGSPSVAARFKNLLVQAGLGV